MIIHIIINSKILMKKHYNKLAVIIYVTLSMLGISSG